jgi:hypothetical protein
VSVARVAWDALHRTAASRGEGESVIARIVNKVPACTAQWGRR